MELLRQIARPDVMGLIILGVCVVLFLTKLLPMAATGVLGCLLMVLCDVCGFEDAFSGFSDSIVLLMAGAMVVGVAMSETGAARLIGALVVRCSAGSEKLFLMVSCLVSGVLSMFLANTAILAIFIPIIESVCAASPAMKRRNLVLPVACAIMHGGVCTLIGCTPQLTANALLSEISGLRMDMWDLTRPGLCLFALFLLYLFFFGYRKGDKVWGGRPEQTMGADSAAWPALDSRRSKAKAAVMLCILAAMIASFIFSWLPTALTVICAAMLCVVTGCCSVKTAVKQLRWETVILLAACLGIANALTLSGAGQLMGGAVHAVLGEGRSAFSVFAVLVLLTLLMSQFITNSTAIIITLPMALALCTEYQFPAMPFCIGITLAASVACCTPLAAAQITMTQVAGYEFSDYLKYTWLPTLISYAGILVFVPLFFPL